MHALLEKVRREALPRAAGGEPASYIPELAKADPDALGLAITCADGSLHVAGEARCPFTVQSISKVLALAYVMTEIGEDAVFSRVGKEPSGDPFNSIIRLETSLRGKPFNPFINAGAIVVSSLMPGGDTADRAAGFVAFARELMDSPNASIDEAVFESERSHAARNRSIAWFLKELGLIEGDVDGCLDSYFMQCSLSATAADLSRLGVILALDGRDPVRDRKLLSGRITRVVKSLMITCGMYDGSGEFAVEVGIPAKSGVGGGIVGAVRERMGIGVYGPALDERGNSIAGVEALKLLSSEMRLSVL